MIHRFLASAALAAVLCATPLAAEPLPADSPVKVGDVAGFTAVRDWSVSQSGNLIRVVAPEGDFTVTVVDLGQSEDAGAAVAAAIGRVPSLAGLKIEETVHPAATDGWDERATSYFEIPPAQNRFAMAAAYRRGERWVVLIADGSQATLGKRGAALATMSASLRPAGFVKEDFSGKRANRLTPERIEELKSFVRSGMDQLKVPGVGMALIEGGKVVWEGGLGLRDPRGKAPVDAHTRFMIASNTKGMATLLLATLADEGKLKWDQPVTALYPGFRLGNDAVTRSVLVRHLVCACTGLPRKDMEWIVAGRATTPAADTFRQLAATQPTSGFGEVFQYNNLMASAAGYVGGHLAYPKLELGAAFDRAMRERVFAPLGMNDTTFDFAVATKGNQAVPTQVGLDDQVEVFDQTFNRHILPYRPAGGAWSSAHDMARYVMLELNKGIAPSGKRLVSAENLLARRAHNVRDGEDSWYGMGLSTRHRHGLDFVYHGGSMAGYKSNWYALPDSGVGLVLLTNSEDGNPLIEPTLRKLVELLYDGRDEAAARLAAAGRSVASERRTLKGKLTLERAAFDGLALAARYRNPDLGDLSFARGTNGQTLMTIGELTGPVAVQRNPDGTSSLVGIGGHVFGFDVLAGGNADGKRTLTLRDAQHVYVYTEV